MKKYIISKIKYFLKSSPRGYMIAMATIMSSIILIISMSLSFVFMREINRSNIPIFSITAYNYADTMLRCLESVQALSVDTQNLQNSGADTADGKGVLDFSTITVDQAKAGRAKCFGKSVFPKRDQTPTSLFADLKLIPTGDSAFPKDYWGGVYLKNAFGFTSQQTNLENYNYFYQGDYKIMVLDQTNVKVSDYTSCVYFELYASTTDQGIPKRLFVVRGKTPCDGGVQRVITKTY
jgi:hypothetical protein